MCGPYAWICVYMCGTTAMPSIHIPSVTQSVCVSHSLLYRSNWQQTNRLWAKQRLWETKRGWERLQESAHSWDSLEWRDSERVRDWWGLENIFAYLHVLCADVLCECAVHCENELIHSWRYIYSGTDRVSMWAKRREISFSWKVSSLVAVLMRNIEPAIRLDGIRVLAILQQLYSKGNRTP